MMLFSRLNAERQKTLVDGMYIAVVINFLFNLLLIYYYVYYILHIIEQDFIAKVL